MRPRLVVGNWKMHGTRAAIETLVEELKRGIDAGVRAEVAVCPPYVYLPCVAERLAGTAIALGAQNLWSDESGAYTGEVSGLMLRDYNCRHVIVGHSERRTLMGEDDDLVGRKFARALAHGLIPILCVGETLAERQAGRTEQTVARQLGAVLDHAGIAAFRAAVVAYEPVWAIGTGRTASPDEAQAVHAFVRGCIAARDPELARVLTILYGGSVNASNAGALFTMADIDGALVGGASLVSDEFLAICRAA